MFCKNCGKQINESDAFCGFCGTKVNVASTENFENESSNNINMGDRVRDNGMKQPVYTHQNINFKETIFGKLACNYFKKPVSIFSLMKNENTTKTSIGFLFGIPVIYGLFHMLFFMSFFKNIVENILHFINNIGSAFGLGYSNLDFYKYSSEISKIKTTVESYLSMNMKYGNYFLNGMISMFCIIAITFIAIEVCNATILKKGMSHKNILFVSTVGFIPLILAIILNNVVIYISFVATVVIIMLGFIVSLITIFSGISQLVDVERDRVFCTILISSAALMCIVPLIMKTSLSSCIETIMGIVKSMNRFF